MEHTVIFVCWLYQCSC